MIGVLHARLAGARVLELFSSPPVRAKVVDGAASPELVLVGSAAGLLEGDRVKISIHLERGAHLVVRTTAATLAYPCPQGGHTTTDVAITLDAGCRLAWLPGPLVAFAGCRHRSHARVSLAPGARALWAELLTCGRAGETVGSVGIRLDATLCGAPLVRDALRVGPEAPGWDGPSCLGGARHVASLHLLGRRAPAELQGPQRMDGAGPSTLFRAIAPDAATLERTVAPARVALLGALDRPTEPSPQFSPHGSATTEERTYDP